jgi:hypothetical protein
VLGRIFSPKFCFQKVALGRSANRVGVIYFDPLPFVRLRHRSSRALCYGMLSGRVLSEAEGGAGCCVSFFACWYLDVALHVGIWMLGCVYIPPMPFLFPNFPFDKLTQKHT